MTAWKIALDYDTREEMESEERLKKFSRGSSMEKRKECNGISCTPFSKKLLWSIPTGSPLINLAGGEPLLFL
jgi:hypothetical protein